MAPSLARDLDELCRASTPTWRFHHNTDLPGIKGATLDPAWISKLRKIDSHCEWIIVSKDGGKNDGKERERLPTVCKCHKIPYFIMSHSIGKTSEQKTAIAEILKQLPDDVVAACKKLIHRKTPHVKLVKFQGKKGTIGYHFRVGSNLLPKFLETVSDDAGSGPDFKLEGP